MLSRESHPLAGCEENLEVHVMRKHWRQWMCFVAALALLPVAGPVSAADEGMDAGAVSLAEFSGFRSEIPGPFGPLAPELFSGRGPEDFIGDGGVFHARVDVPAVKVLKSGNLFLHVACLETERCHYPLVVSIELPDGACRSYIVTFREDERKVIDVMDELLSLGLSAEDNPEEASALAVHLISNFRFQVKTGHRPVPSTPQLDSAITEDVGELEELGFEDIPSNSSDQDLTESDFCCGNDHFLCPIYTEIPRSIRWPAWIRVLDRDRKYDTIYRYDEIMDLECYYPTTSVILHKTWEPSKTAGCHIEFKSGWNGPAGINECRCKAPEYIETRQESAYSCHILWYNVCGVVRLNEVGDAVGAADCKSGCGPYKYYRR